MTSPYFCPTAREVEIHPGGGFTVCCDRPELHIPVTNGPMIPATVQILDEAKRADYQTTQRLAALEADGDRLARAADDLSHALAGAKQRADTAEAQVARIRAFLEDMAGWCSPHGVAADYARRGLDALDGVDPFDAIRPREEQP